jgi:hypothetical protein
MCFITNNELPMLSEERPASIHSSPRSTLPSNRDLLPDETPRKPRKKLTFSLNRKVSKNFFTKRPTTNFVNKNTFSVPRPTVQNTQKIESILRQSRNTN